MKKMCRVHKKPSFKAGGDVITQDSGPQPVYEQALQKFVGKLKEQSANFQQDENVADALAIQESINKEMPELKDGGSNWMKAARKGMNRKGTVGKFTEHCGGKITNDCIEKALNSPDETVRQRAQFAQAARAEAASQAQWGGFLPMEDGQQELPSARGGRQQPGFYDINVGLKTKDSTIGAFGDDYRNSNRAGRNSLRRGFNNLSAGLSDVYSRPDRYQLENDHELFDGKDGVKLDEFSVTGYTPGKGRRHSTLSYKAKGHEDRMSPVTLDGTDQGPVNPSQQNDPSQQANPSQQRSYQGPQDDFIDPWGQGQGDRDFSSMIPQDESLTYDQLLNVTNPTPGRPTELDLRDREQSFSNKDLIDPYGGFNQRTPWGGSDDLGYGPDREARIEEERRRVPQEDNPFQRHDDRVTNRNNRRRLDGGPIEMREGGNYFGKYQGQYGASSVPDLNAMEGRVKVEGLEYDPAFNTEWGSFDESFLPEQPKQYEMFEGDPSRYDVTEEKDIQLRKQSKWKAANEANPYLASDTILGGMDLTIGALNMMGNPKKKQDYEQRVSDPFRTNATTGKASGDYTNVTQKAGNPLMPDQHTRWGKGTKMAQAGHEIEDELDLTEDQIQELLAQGYELEYV